MPSHAAVAQRSRLSRSAIIRAVLALGTVVGIGTTLTLAAWTDTGTASATFTSGKIDLTLNEDQATPSYAFSALSITSGMKPGDVKYATLDVKNNGTVPYTYTMAGTATAPTNTLHAALRLTIKSLGVSTTATTLPANNCTQTTFDAAATTVSAAGAPGSAAIAARPLTAGQYDHLCFKIELPTGADNDTQDKTAAFTFKFDATSS
jgi:predicted ribosomally synthesized peptide with SipW-like signal peptide